VQLDLVGNRQRFADHSQQTGNGNPCDTGSATGICNFSLDDYRGVFNTTQYEARLSNVNPGLLDYVAGANWYQERVEESDHNYSAPVATYNDVITWIQGIDPVNVTQHKSYGLFAQFTLHPTSRLSLIAGARYTHDQNTRVGTFATPGNTCQGNVYPTDCIGGANNGTEVDQKVTWKLGVNYQLTSANLLYASVSTGFKGGGFNDFSPTTGSVAPYGPESLTAYELGYKGKLLPGLTLTSAIYAYDYTQDQINSLVLFPTAAGVAGVLYTQLAPVKIYGWDNEVRYQVDKDTALSGALAYNHTRIVRFTAGQFQHLTGQYGDFSGQPLNNSPEWTFNLAATHKFELSNGSQIRARLATKYSGSYWLTSYASVASFKQPAFARTDASLTYATPGDAVTVQLFVENLENKVQRTAGPNGYHGTYGGTATGAIMAPSAEANGSGYPLGSLGYGVSTPRFFGVRIGAKY
jgi:iron complex outermembrane receptor protein